MALLDIFKRKPQPKTGPPRLEKEIAKKEPKPEKSVKKEVKGQKPEQKKFKIERIILIKPIITEKASGFGELNKYLFEVAPGANKLEIKKAIEALYGFTPVKVNIIPVKGKKIRYGRVQGRTKNWKKAIITLKKGDRIELYERK